MARIKITLEYDGTNYSGWQIQKNTSQTVQQVVSGCLSKINKSEVKLSGAGRTDAGVHALGQTASCSLDVNIPVKKIPAALNSLLPVDIICRGAELVADNFHARYDARGKKYRYRIYNQPVASVFNRNYVYHLKQPLDLEAMVKASQVLTGEHDFAAFQASGSSIKDTVRIIESIDFIKHDNELWLEITGNGFLYKMVRIITGTLLEIGLGKLKSQQMELILKSKNREQAGVTAPAKGLTLVEVYY